MYMVNRHLSRFSFFVFPYKYSWSCPTRVLLPCVCSCCETIGLRIKARENFALCLKAFVSFPLLKEILGPFIVAIFKLLLF